MAQTSSREGPPSSIVRATAAAPELLWTTGLVGLVAIALPYLPFAATLGFTPLPLPVLVGLMVISLAFAATLETVKRLFFRDRGRHPAALR